MVAVAAKKPLKYPVTPEWKAGVRAELEKRGRGSHAWLAREIRCSSGELSELLGPDSKYSDLVAPIHKVFGWKMPAPPLPGSPDVLELDYLVEKAKLGDEERVLLVSVIDALRDDASPDRRVAAMALLKLLRSAQND
jgi:hypothetical protein